jgi:hypothetical protein
MPNLDKIYLWHGRVIYHGTDGLPYVPDTLAVAYYITYASNEGELSAAMATHHNAGTHPSKLLFLMSREGPGGARTGLLYKWDGDRSITVVDRGRSHRGHVAGVFSVFRGGGSLAWERDYAAGLPGLFVTGTSGYGNIYRLERIESDPFGRLNITILPLRVVGAVPPVKLSGVQDGALRSEAEEHYQELQAAFSSASSRALVKHIASLVEACLTDRLRSRGIPAPRNLAPMLEEVRQLLEHGSRDLLKEGGYHSAQSVRLVYQRTHPEAAARAGSPIEPEEALALLQDMKRVLGD